MNSPSKLESLEHANDWLTKRLHQTEEQLREGEDINNTLTDENRQLKTARTSLSSRLADLANELQLLRASVKDHSSEKLALLDSISTLEQQLCDYKEEEQNAKMLAEELKYEMEKAQDIISSKVQEEEDMRSYISQLEDRNEKIQEKSDTQLLKASKIISEKEETMQQLRRTMNDMELAASFQGSEPCADHVDSLAAALAGGEDNFCHSSPVQIEDSVEYLQQQLIDRDNSMKELEMKLESVLVANEIYQDELKDLRCKLDGGDEDSSLADTHSNEEDENDRAIHETVDKLLAQCEKINGEITNDTQQSTMNDEQKESPTIASYTEGTIDISTHSDDSIYYSYTPDRYLCDIYTQTSVSTDDKLTQCNAEPMLASSSSQTDNMERKKTVSSTQTMVKSFSTLFSQTESTLHGQEVGSQTEWAVIVADGKFVEDEDHVDMPKLCDAVVECSLLVDQLYGGIESVDNCTQTAAITESIEESVKDSADSPSRDIVDAEVQTDKALVSEDNMVAIFSNLQLSLKGTSQAIEELNSCGIFSDAAEDNTTAKTSSSAIPSLSAPSPGKDLNVFNNSLTYGKEFGGGDAALNYVCTARPGHMTQRCVAEVLEDVCVTCNGRESKGNLMSNLACTGTIIMVMILCMVLSLLMGLGNFNIAVQRIAGQAGLPPH